MKYLKGWSPSEVEVADAYGDTLSSLKENSKPVINTLTELANEYRNEHPHIIVYSIEERVKEVPNELKLTVMYLMDSIVKNHADPYRKLFAKNVVTTFLHVFKSSNEKVRALLHKLRTTWTDIFPFETMLRLDKAVNVLDPAWPIAKQKVQQTSNIHINPAVFSRNSKPAPTQMSDTERIAAEMKRKKLELIALQEKKLQLELEAMEKSLNDTKKTIPPIRPEPSAAVAKEPSQNILINPRRVKDPRIRQTLPKEITELLDKGSNKQTPESSSSLPEPSQSKSRSKTPEIFRSNSESRHRSATPEKKSKPTSTTSSSQPESPTSTSQDKPEKMPKAPSPPLIRDELKQSSAKMSRSSSRKISSSDHYSHKTSSDQTSSHKSGSKSDHSSHRSSKSRKRDREKSHDSRDKTKRNDSKESPVRKREKDDSTTTKISSPPLVQSSPPRVETKPEPMLDPVVAQSSQPDPIFKPTQNENPEQKPNLSPELKVEAVPEEAKVTPQIAQTMPDPRPNSEPEPNPDTSSELDRCVSSSPSPPTPPKLSPPKAPNRKQEQAKFRIPKKQRTPSPNKTKEDGTLNPKGRRVQPVGKKRPESHVNVDRRGKKVKLNEDLFGDDMSSETGPSTQPIRSLGWAKFKEVNPDEFRTPIKTFGDIPYDNNCPMPGPMPRGPGGPEQGWFDHNNRGMRMESNRMPQNDPRQHRGPPARNFNGNMFPGNFSGPRPQGPFAGGPMGPHQSMHQNAVSDSIGHFFQEMGSTDPEVVLNQVIPVILRQAQENLATGRLNPKQFSNLMGQVMQLKEQAMMLHADKLHRIETGGRGKPGPPNSVRLPPTLNNPPWQQIGQRPMRPVDDLGKKGQGGMPFMPPPPPPVPLFAPKISALKAKAKSFPEVPPESGENRDPVDSVINRDLPMAPADELEQIKSDPVTTIDIDHRPRDIRFFGEMATIILGPADVRKLSFKTDGPLGATRRVIIDNKIRLALALNASNYTTFTLNKTQHKIKIGAPTRELWIDGKWYQCYFNESITVRLGTQNHNFFLEGPPPNVNIGQRPLKEICLGTVQVIIDANINWKQTIYLDPKPQLVNIAGKPHILKFVDGISMLLINGHPFKITFGQLIMVYVNQEKHFLRLTTLPEGVHTSRVKFISMDDLEKSFGEDNSGPASPPGPPSPPSGDNENSMDGGGFENKAFDRILGMLPSPSVPKSDKSNRPSFKYSSETSLEKNLKEAEVNRSVPETSNATARVPSPPPVDIHNLWSQLLGAGLIAEGASSSIPGLDNVSAKPEKPEPKKEEVVKQKPLEPIKPVSLKSHDKSLKERQLGLIQQMYNPSALQCKNCGLRYSPEDMIPYSQHLDWHFRMNRREKEMARKAQSRQWFFERMDWINSDEIEDEEKVFGEESETAKEDEVEVIPAVPVSSNPNGKTCPVCNEDFEEFYKEDANQEKDDGGLWYFRNSVTSDGHNYHPQCLEDKNKNESTTISEDDLSKSNIDESMEVDTSEVKEEATALEEEDVPMPDSSTSINIKGEPSEVEAEPAAIQPVVKVEPVLPQVEPVKPVTIKQEPVDDSAGSLPTSSQSEEQPMKTDEETPQSLDVVVKVESTPEDKVETESSEEAATPVQDRSLDGNAVAETAPSFVAPTKLTGASIRINLTSQIEPVKSLERRESVVSNSSVAGENSEFDPEGIIQPPKSEPVELKPKLKDRKLVEMPPQNKGIDTSGLCSIM